MKEEIKKVFTEWYDLSKEKRQELGLPVTAAEFGRMHNTTEVTLSLWGKAIKKLRGEVPPDEYEEFVKHLKNLCRSGGTSNDRKLYAQIMGWLVERKEEKLSVEFSPGDRVRISQEVISGLKRSYQEHGGVCPVCGKSTLLLESVRQDTEQEHGADSKVGAVAVFI